MPAIAAARMQSLAPTTPRGKAWAILMAGVGEQFPLLCPACGGDIQLRGTGRQEPAHFEPEVCKREKARMASPARGPPTDWGELVQAHNDRDVFQASRDELPAIEIHSL